MLLKTVIYFSSDLMFNMRIGFGKDIHKLKRGYPLILGGVKISFKKGLFSFSDGDVVIHAIVDSLLGAMALGDIGKFFPESKEENRGRSSIEFLKVTNDLLKKQKYIIENIDVTILCEKPKLRDYIDIIRGSIAIILGIDVSKISIKACTNEKFDAVGKGKAIEAISVVLLK